MIDKTAFRIIKKSEDKNDFAFWLTQSYEARLQALESIREEYNSWNYDPKQGFQRVYRVVKRK